MSQAICFNPNCRKTSKYTFFKEKNGKCYCEKCGEFIGYHIKTIGK